MDFKIGNIESGSAESIASEEFAERALAILEKDSKKTYLRFRNLAKSVYLIPHVFISMAPAGNPNLRIRIDDSIVEVPRENSFCGCVLDRSEILVVKNAIEDSRFRDNPMVADKMHIRFYAGVPLVGSTGEAFGTICAMDTIPREFDESRLAILMDLSKQIVEHLESEVRNEILLERLNSRIAHLNLSDTRLDLAETAGFDSSDRAEDSKSTVFLDAEVGKIFDLYSVEANSKRIKLESSIPEKFELSCDPELLSMILQRTLFNGIKFCLSGGSVKIDAWKAARDVLISITDTGAGMEPERVQRLLGDSDPVYGLPVCKRLLETSNGQLDLLSEKGMGTTVTVTLPL